MKPGWFKEFSSYEKPVLYKSIWQLFNSLFAYGAIFSAMIIMLLKDFPYWAVLPLAIPGGIFMVRLFIIFHDCAHGSFFRSSRANKIWGYVTGFISLTPYSDWRHAHAIHHASVANLDKRGTGDIWTMTVDEYLASNKFKKFAYRIVRNPVILFVFGPAVLFIILQRFPQKCSNKQDIFSIMLVNFLLILAGTLSYFTIGLGNYLLVHLSIILVGGCAGMWLFYVQHQFEDVYWSHIDSWDRVKASMLGSSFYKLPKILQWATGNIGFHHIHHLNPSVPNYNLQKCFKNIPEVQKIKAITFFKSLKSLFLNIYDEHAHKLINFRKMKYYIKGHGVKSV